MDGISLGLFLLAAFLGGLTTGLAGFAMGVVVTGIWLHVITPVQTTLIMVGYALFTQGYAIWVLRHALDWRLAGPFLITLLVSVPLGAALLTTLDTAYLRAGVGVLLILYGAYGLLRPSFKPVRANLAADLGIGFANGLLGGLTGLSGIIITIWCQLRGWPKDVQRAVFQPVIFLAAVLTAVSLGFAGAVTVETVRLWLYGFPFVFAGMWVGLKLYGRLDDAAFRKVILWLLLVAGLTLIVPASLLRSVFVG